MKNLLLKSYAKINVCLNIVNKREDGYHDLDMVMLPIELHDSILLTELCSAQDNFVTIDDFSLGTLDYNLATFAIDKMASIYNFDNKFRILIHKVTPIQAGLGGGSSNAAFAVKGVNQYLKLGLSRDQLIDIVAPLGADIPFFIDCKPARCTGIGNILSPINIKNNYFVLIVKPEVGCSTKTIFNLADQQKTKSGNVDDVVKALETGDDDLLAKSMFNSLEDPAISLVPEIKEIKDYLIRKGLKMVQMTGSGSAVFALSTDKSALKQVAKELENKYTVEITKVIK